MTFGEYIKGKRLEVNLSLRKFCVLMGLDPSNWSKVERGINKLALDSSKLEEMANLLEFENRSEERVKFFDLAAVAKREIPEYVYNDKEVLDALPVFFRTASREKPTDGELDKLIQLIKSR